MLRLFMGVLLCASAVAHAAATDDERFNAWLDEVWEETLVRYPVRATFIGDPRYNAELPNFTTAKWRAEDRRFRQRQLGDLKRFNRPGLSPANRLSYDVLKSDLEVSLEGDRFPDWLLPVDQLDSFPQFIGWLGGGGTVQPFATVRDYDDWAARATRSVPVLDGMIANMRIGIARGVTQPRPLMEKALPQLAALALAVPEESIFWGPVKAMPESISGGDRARIENQYRALITRTLAPAYKRMHAFIRDEYLPKCRTTTGWSALPNGKAWYAYLVRLRTTTDLAPDQIHALGRQEVARTLRQLDDVRKTVGFEGDLPSFFLNLRNDPRFYFTQPDEAIAAFAELQTRINARLSELFNTLPKADYVIRPVEEFRAKSAPAASYVDPSADGTRRGIFYINTLNLKALPKYETETLSLHEASPGHHFQISIAQEMTTLPKFRRFGAFNVAYVEGWALYAESIGRELGLFSDPYQWYGHLNAAQLRSMRLVVDTGLHDKGWSREQAIEYMMSNSSMAESDVIVEVERYMSWPGQALGYRIGQLEIARLRREAAASLGPRFDVKEFHRIVLTNGSLPLKLLADEVSAWVARESRASTLH